MKKSILIILCCSLSAVPVRAQQFNNLNVTEILSHYFQVRHRVRGIAPVASHVRQLTADTNNVEHNTLRFDVVRMLLSNLRDRNRNMLREIDRLASEHVNDNQRQLLNRNLESVFAQTQQVFRDFQRALRGDLDQLETRFAQTSTWKGYRKVASRVGTVVAIATAVWPAKKGGEKAWKFYQGK